MLIYKLYHFAIDFSSKLVILILSKICSFKIFSLVALHISWINSIIVNTTVLRASTVLRLKHYSCWPCLVKTLGCAMRWRREEQSVFEILLWESHQSENSLLSFPKPLQFVSWRQAILWILFFFFLDTLVILTLKNTVSLLN